MRINNSNLSVGNILKYLLVVISLFFQVATAYAEEPLRPGIWVRMKDSLLQTWDSTDYELYVPISAWHNRSYYSSEKIDTYNEQPWGLGLGKYRFDEEGDWHALYVMAFQDSHSDIEPLAGYAFQKIWRPTDDLRLGVGYSVGLTLRKDYNYLPLPILAPLFSVEYKRLALQSTYIPGGTGNGNILFTWLRWQLQ
ncbi:MAG: lipid IV(A) palmitoyltransferase PagP [Methylotenera sp.]|nr:lipid IV(A) palmitoyltransferase PagP [Methylotenera sp.]